MVVLEIELSAPTVISIYHDNIGLTKVGRADYSTSAAMPANQRRAVILLPLVASRSSLLSPPALRLPDGSTDRYGLLQEERG